MCHLVTDHGVLLGSVPLQSEKSYSCVARRIARRPCSHLCRLFVYSTMYIFRCVESGIAWFLPGSRTE